MKIPVVLDKGAYLPVRAHAWDAGMDLRTPVDVQIRPHGSAVVDTGVHMAIPEGYWGKVELKSGLNFKQDIITDGAVDCKYTGSVRVKLYNMSSLFKRFKKGDKIAQIIITPCVCDTELEPVNALDDTERGDGGFGSTGR